MVLTIGNLNAQSWQLPLERGMTESIEQVLSTTDTTVHTGMKPFHYDQFTWDSIPRFFVNDRRYFNLTEVKFLRDHLIEIEEDDFTLFIDAVLDWDIGFDFGDTSSWQDSVQIFNNTRGIAAFGRIGERVSFHATVFENQTQFPQWLYTYTDSLQVIPGQGRFKELESNARDYNSAQGVVSIDAAKWLQVHFGHGRHFIGHGYRSMILSDVAFSYPFLRLQAEAWKKRIKYMVLNAEMNSLDRLPRGEVPEALFQRKGFSFRYLSVMPHPRVELGLFEGVVWQRWDSTGTKRPPAAFYAPVPGVATALYGLDSTQNVMLGGNLRVKVTDDLSLYGQYVLDQSDLRFHGFQAGLKWNNLLVNRLNLRLEYNEGAPGTYTHRTTLQNYSHMNQGLAHPLGSNFKEYVAILQHGHKRFWSEWRGIYQIHDGGARGNIASPTPDLLNAPHEPGVTMHSDLQFGYLMNPTSNTSIIMGWRWRNRIVDNSSLISSMYYLAFRVAMFNRYYDV